LTRKSENDGVRIFAGIDGLFYVGRMKRDEIKELIDSEKNG
jgi:hypothetical protein